MAEDWDLFAVVRSCASSAATTATATTDESNREEPLACLASLTFELEENPFSFPNLAQTCNNNGSLQDSYRPFLPTLNPTTTANNLSSTSSAPGEFSGRHNQQQPPTPTTSIMGINTPTQDPVFAFGQSRNQQQPQYSKQHKPLIRQQRVQPPVVQPPAVTNLPLRSMHSQGPKSRKRKNHQKRTVCQVTADKLSSDPWAWRKYGQKPIKNSSYPRNYYRCSSSKGCLARKQVERSNLDPNIFTVTYTGEHTHPKPTHRNSLAGSTRSKLSALQKSSSGKSSAASETAADACCSSPLSATSVSPTTPLPAREGGGNEKQDADVENGAADGNDQEMLDGESDEDDMLIPNVKIDEDLFTGLREITGGPGGCNSGLGQSPPFGNDFSWGTGGTAISGATAGDGC